MSFSFDVSEREVAEADWILDASSEVASKVRDRLRELEMSQADLASELGKERSVISRELSGRSNLTLRTIGALCWAVGLRPVLTLDGIPDDEAPSNAPAPAAPVARAYSCTNHYIPAHTSAGQNLSSGGFKPTDYRRLAGALHQSLAAREQ